MTGAAGQLGQALLASAPAGATVVGLARGELDICSASDLAAIMGAHRPDLVVNAAAYTAVDRAESEPEAAFAANRDAPARLAETCRAIGIPIVHISTDFVFDGTACSPYLRWQVPAPVGTYGASKAAGEQAVHAAHPNALIVRTGWVYSATGSNFMLTMLGLMQRHPVVRVVADQVGTPTHAASLARAVWELAGGGATGIYHFTDAGVASWYDFAVAIQEEALTLGLLSRTSEVIPIRTVDYPTPTRRPAYSVLDKTETYARLARPVFHWRAELRRALADLKGRPNG